jgi:ATP-dependent Clp protease ATP-binding subunit ClpC
MLDPALLKQAKAERDRLHELQHDVERARSDYHHAIRRLSAAGGTLREIADALGLSHQRVHQIVEQPIAADLVHRAVPLPPFARQWTRGLGTPSVPHFSDDARRVVALAQEEAFSLRHKYVGTEHLLLAILRLESGPARDVLRTLNVTHEAARAAVAALTGEGADEVTGRLPFTPRAKKALELALREKQARKAGCIEPEHLLLVLAREPETVSAKVLAQLGVDEPKLAAEIDRRLAA